MKEYRLNVDPRILELLGPSLYTNIYYVLAELIANAYDADAKNVYIIASDHEIRVEDDGHGMSYETGDIDRYLNVAGVSRTSEDEATTLGGRRKMGRKGVGKLAALSVSEEVDVLTTTGTERSGFVLARRPVNGNELSPIADDDIVFAKIESHGSAIVMRKPQYALHKTLAVVERNLIKMFPIVNKSFRIHLIRGAKHVIVDSFDQSIMSELSTLITLGPDFERLTKLVSNPYPDRRADLVSSRPIIEVPLTLTDNEGAENEYLLEVHGWIGTYKSTRGRKVDLTDFPDNFISLFANGKLGEFNILPIVGQNKLSEVYVVGQLHVDLFELTELPDMALSNRQGYKSDDPRYAAILDVGRDLLAEVRRRRDAYAALENLAKKRRKEEEQDRNESKLREAVDGFRRETTSAAASEIIKLGSAATAGQIRDAVDDAINTHIPDLGLKSVVDTQKKKLLISQTWPDKPFSDVLEKMLTRNGIPKDDILYTNSDDENCRIPEDQKVYEYLRKFFVESYSTQRIMVLFVTSENTPKSWGALTEVGASWITQVDHKIFNIRPFRPEHPLDDESLWQTTNREKVSGELWVDQVNADIFCQKVEAVADALGYTKQSREANRAYLETLIDVRQF